MILNFFISLLSILGLIFSPLEAGLAASSNNSSDSSAQGSVALSNVGSAAMPRALAGVVVPDSAQVVADFDDFEADRGEWVGAGDFDFATLTFTVQEHIAEDEDGQELVLRDSNRATIRATNGCTEYSADGFIGIFPQMETSRMIRINECEPRNLGDEAKLRMLFDSEPVLYSEGDTLWIASQTQVARFERVEAAN